MVLKAVFVGINRYRDPVILELSAARRDAMALWALFTNTNEELAAQLLIDEEATHSAVAEAILGTLEVAQKDDAILISFAGYGSPDGSQVMHNKVLQPTANPLRDLFVT